MRDEKATRKMAEDGQRGLHIQKNTYKNQQARKKFKQLQELVFMNNSYKDLNESFYFLQPG